MIGLKVEDVFNGFKDRVSDRTEFKVKITRIINFEIEFASGVCNADVDCEITHQFGTKSTEMLSGYRVQITISEEGNAVMMLEVKKSAIRNPRIGDLIFLQKAPAASAVAAAAGGAGLGGKRKNRRGTKRVRRTRRRSSRRH